MSGSTTTMENTTPTVSDGEAMGSNGASSKICSVCGDKALGCNFNAITCESCKAFFRRNALSKKRFTCPFNEKCEITIVTRRFCQKCRLEKCFQIGMKKEYIMSEEDKVMKRKKIEQNRAKKRLSNGQSEEAIDGGGGGDIAGGGGQRSMGNSSTRNGVPIKIKREKSIEIFDASESWNNSSSSEYCSTDVGQAIGLDPSNSSNHSHASNDTMAVGLNHVASPSTEFSSSNADPSATLYNQTNSLSSEAELLSAAVASLQQSGSSAVGRMPSISLATERAAQAGGSASRGSTGDDSQLLPPLTIDSSAEDIVNRIVNYPTRASQTIASLMKTPRDAVFIMSKIIQSQCDALKLISHFISAPGDALQIISKIMNSPLDALTVFAQFMSSPTDALQLIGKIVSSPSDVLQFMQQLMNQPEDALQIMNKFMSSPAEALQMINKMMNHSDIVKTIKEAADTSQKDDDEQQHRPPQTQQRPPETVPCAADPADTVSSEQHQMIRSLMQDSVTFEPVTTPLSASASPSSTSNYEPPYSSMLDPLLSSTTVHSGSTAAAAAAGAGGVYHSDHGALGPSHSPHCSTDMADVMFASSTFGQDLSNPAAAIPMPASEDLDIFQDIETKPITPNSLESVLMQAIKLEYEGYNSAPIGGGGVSGGSGGGGVGSGIGQQTSSVGSNSIELNDAERAKLNELIVANKALYAPVDDDLASLISDDCRIKTNQPQQDPQLLKVINLTAIAIRRLIKMSKKISAFKNMCQEDQLALLKGGCTEMMILRSAMQYDCDRATWKIPHSQEEMSNIRADVLKLAKGNVYQEHERFIRTFDKKWRSDENIILIMCAITLFSPARPKTIHSDVIKLEQNSYYYLLRRYLESIYPGCEARSVFLKLMQKISELHRLNDEIISVYLNVNPSEVEPLLREIFDLKVH
ncbi:nuclear hormone receptor HR96-like [Anopheles albimanus]|uniref:Nuclear hormone receptor HR96 n=1 Tax=Anopheles albimanus TaxID=7167 RepID=A0A8W7JWC0_ANOAL|nr:nuclear hormone receptor HR96-like [Anopheles albimanus]